MSKALTAKRARELLSYDPETGILRWRVRRGPARAGTVTGCDDGKGYLVVGVGGRIYRAHRLAWLIRTGRWPHEIDHINGVRDDNRWCNLREVVRQENGRNQRFRCTNTSGHIGVYWNKQCAKWQAYITVSGQANYLGVFDEIDEAVAARKAAEREHGFHENHGSKP